MQAVDASKLCDWVLLGQRCSPEGCGVVRVTTPAFPSSRLCSLVQPSAGQKTRMLHGVLSADIAAGSFRGGCRVVTQVVCPLEWMVCTAQEWLGLGCWEATCSLCSDCCPIAVLAQLSRVDSRARPSSPQARARLVSTRQQAKQVVQLQLRCPEGQRNSQQLQFLPAPDCRASLQVSKAHFPAGSLIPEA